MATEWFCKIMGDEQGPMTAAELHTLARAGRLTIDDLVRKHADGSWVRAENVIGLFDRPSLPVVLKELIAVIDDFASVAASWQATVGRTAAGGQRCSLEVETTQSRSACSRTAAKSTVCEGRPAAGRGSLLVRRPAPDAESRRQCYRQSGRRKARQPNDPNCRLQFTRRYGARHQRVAWGGRYGK